MQRDNIIISRIAETDIPILAELEKKYIPEPWSEQSFRSAYESKNSILLGAYQGTLLQGYVSASFVLDEVSINSIAVSEEIRRQGVGEKLLSALEKEVENFAAFITLEVRESNLSAQKLYEKLGYKQVGLRRNFYRSPVENAILMTKYF